MVAAGGYNLDVIKTADWVIDLGPDGGIKGGEIVAAGTPEQIITEPRSATGFYLKPLLDKPRAEMQVIKTDRRRARAKETAEA